MTNHPKERPNSLSRRGFLLRSAGAAVAFSGAGPLLAACGNTTSVPESTGAGGELVGPGGLPLARPDKRVTLPRWEDPIESGLEPETGGTFTVFNYPSYLYKKVLTEFGAKYGVEVRVHAVRQRQLRTPAACLRSGHARRDGDHAGHARYRRCRQADQAAQPRLHPEPQEEHLAAARRPVLRRRVALHRSLHRLRHRHRMADGQGQRGHRRHEPAVGHLLGVSGVQAARWRSSPRTGRRSAWRSCARGSRTSTPRIPRS